MGGPAVLVVLPARGPGKRRRSGSSGDRPGARRGRPAPGRSRRELSLVPGGRPAARPSPSWAGWKRRALRGGQVLTWASSEPGAGSGPRVEAGGHPPSLCVLSEAWSHSPQWVSAWCCPSCLLWWPSGTHTCQPPPTQGQVGGDTGDWGRKGARDGQTWVTCKRKGPEGQARAHPRLRCVPSSQSS